MLILAIDSTGAVATSAILDDTRVICKSSVKNGLKHSEILLPMIKKQLSENNISLSDIGLFACSAGPGSFTGVRIGVATVKGLAFGSRSCVGVSALEALAYNLRDKNGIICAVMDARRGQLYNALFRNEDGVITRLCNDRAISAQELAEEMHGYKESIYLVGDGYYVAGEYINNANVVETKEDKRDADAESVGLLALCEYKKGKAVTDAELTPIYLRVPQAERERNERLAENGGSSNK